MSMIPEDIADIMKPTMRWRWLIVPNQPRAWNVVIETTGGQVTRLDYHGEADRQEVLTALFESCRKRRERRKASALRGAETRKRRRASQDYAVAKLIIEGQFTPQPWCACCRRPLTDRVSIRRGIGSECWHTVKSLIDQMTIGNV